MEDNYTIAGKEIVKWGILSISLYMNFSGMLGLFFKIISMAIVLSHGSVKFVIAFEMVSYIFKLGFLIMALVLVKNRIADLSVIKYPRGLAITSFILLPVVLLFQFAAQAGNALIMSTMSGPAYMGEYAMFSRIASISSNSLTFITLMIFGLVVAARNN